MPFNGSGFYTPPGTDFPAVPSTLIESTKYNGVVNDQSTALSTCITKDGQTTITANLPMSGYKHTNVAAGAARTDYAAMSNLQDRTGVYVATVGGTANAITLTPSPAIAAYAAGQQFSFIASGANTTAVTVNVSGLGAKAITKSGATALTVGDIPASSIVLIEYDGTQFQIVRNGAASSGAITTSGLTMASQRMLGRTAVGTGPIEELQFGSVIRSYISGLTYANNTTDATNDIDVNVGLAVSDDGTYLMSLGSAITKRIDAAWAVGSGNGGLMSAAALTNQVYGIWLIARSDTGVVDVGFDASLTAPTLPANYDKKRLIGWIQRVAGALRAVTVLEIGGGGIHVGHAAPPMDVDSAALTTSRLLSTLASAPIGIRVEAEINGFFADAGGAIVIVRDPAETDVAPNSAASPGLDVNIAAGVGATLNKTLFTNASGQIAARASAAVDTYRVFVIGYKWGRM